MYRALADDASADTSFHASSSVNLSFALPLPDSMNDILKEDEIMQTLKLVKTMIEENYIESLYEASKIFSDLVEANVSESRCAPFLTDQVIDTVLSILESLLSSDNIDVLRIVFFIIEKLSQLSSYQTKFSNSLVVLNCLIVSVNPKIDASEQYLLSHSKISAINILSTLASNFPYLIVKQLVVVGYARTFWESLSSSTNLHIREAADNIISSLSSISYFNQ